MQASFLPLLGSWTGAEHQYASPWAPASTARAFVVFRLDVAATLVVQDYRQVRADGAELTAHGVFQSVAGEDAVRWWLFDSYGEPPLPAAGRWADGELRLERTSAHGAARHRFRPVEDQLEYEITVRLGDADAWSPFLTGRYRRISGH